MGTNRVVCKNQVVCKTQLVCRNQVVCRNQMCKGQHLASRFWMFSIRLIPCPSFSGPVGLHISYRASTNLTSIRISIAAFGGPCARHQLTFLVQRKSDPPRHRRTKTSSDCPSKFRPRTSQRPYRSSRSHFVSGHAYCLRNYIGTCFHSLRTVTLPLPIC